MTTATPKSFCTLFLGGIHYSGWRHCVRETFWGRHASSAPALCHRSEAQPGTGPGACTTSRKPEFVPGRYAGLASNLMPEDRQRGNITSSACSALGPSSWKSSTSPASGSATDKCSTMADGSRR